MSPEMTILGVGAALVIGAGGAWWRVNRDWSRKFDLKLRQLNETHRKHHEAVIDKLNASHASAKKELEQQRGAMPRPLAAAAADQRSTTVARLEEQLRAAYTELDLLRLEVRGPAPAGEPEAPSGFADTQPFVPKPKSRFGAR